MEKRYTNKTLPKLTGKSRMPLLSFLERGCIAFSMAALQHIMADKSTKLSFFVDDDKNWYLYKDNDGFEIKYSNSRRCVYHMELTDLFFRDNELVPGTIKCSLAATPTVIDNIEYWGILIIFKR